MKFNLTFTLAVLLSLLIGGISGYYAMPEKEVKIIVPEIKEVPYIVERIIEKNITITDCKAHTRDISGVTGILKSTRSCVDWLENQNINQAVPFCWMDKKILNMTDLNVGCKLTYSYGC